MKSLLQVKQAQQDQYLRSLKDASHTEKAKIALQNSGFAAAIYKKRHLVSVKFGK